MVSRAAIDFFALAFALTLSAASIGADALSYAANKEKIDTCRALVTVDDKYACVEKAIGRFSTPSAPYFRIGL